MTILCLGEQRTRPPVHFACTSPWTKSISPLPDRYLENLVEKEKSTVFFKKGNIADAHILWFLAAPTRGRHALIRVSDIWTVRARGR